MNVAQDASMRAAGQVTWQFLLLRTCYCEQWWPEALQVRKWHLWRVDGCCDRGHHFEALEEVVWPVVRWSLDLLWWPNLAECRRQGPRASGLHQHLHGTWMPGYSAARWEAKRLYAADCWRDGKPSVFVQKAQVIVWPGSLHSRIMLAYVGSEVCMMRQLWLPPHLLTQTMLHQPLSRHRVWSIQWCIPTRNSNCLCCKCSGLCCTLSVPVCRTLWTAACQPRHHSWVVLKQWQWPGTGHAGWSSHSHGFLGSLFWVF